MTFSNPTIVWFRNDLRTLDHAALYHAAKIGAPIIPIFIHDRNAMGMHDYGGANKYWLHHSLAAHSKELQNLGLNLVLRAGDTREILMEIAAQTNANKIYCQRNYEPWQARQETKLREYFSQNGFEFKRFAGNLLIEPEVLKTGGGTDFQVFTPFFRALQSSNQIRKPMPKLENAIGFEGKLKSDDLNDWNLLPSQPNWAQGFDALWKIGEKAALQRLENFIPRINGYGENRNFPAIDATSKLSPHLRFGEISPAQIWQEVEFASGGAPYGDYQKFLSELVWREFSYHLMTRLPDIATKPIKTKFENFPWCEDAAGLKAWQKGQTGYPIIDAGMRELWATGYMHNRVRMIVASFLIKDLLVPWQEGERWFWDCLLDADFANNAASWQWVAGCGMDAAPYFRIFNPTTQGQKFDAKGEYIRKWVPQIAGLSNEFIHEPSSAPLSEQKRAGVIIGSDYPLPIVNHKMARDRALAALKALD